MLAGLAGCFGDPRIEIHVQRDPSAYEPTLATCDATASHCNMPIQVFQSHPDQQDETFLIFIDDGIDRVVIEISDADGEPTQCVPIDLAPGTLQRELAGPPTTWTCPTGPCETLRTSCEP